MLGKMDDNNREIEMQRLEIRRLRDQMSKVVTHVSTRPDFTIDPELQRLIQPVTNTAQASPISPIRTRPVVSPFLRGGKNKK